VQADYPHLSCLGAEIQVNLFKIAFKKNFLGDIKYGKSRGRGSVRCQYVFSLRNENISVGVITHSIQ
jgi:hypothetical protein